MPGGDSRDAGSMVPLPITATVAGCRHHLFPLNCGGRLARNALALRGNHRCARPDADNRAPVQLRVETVGFRGQQRLFNQPKTKRRLRRQMARQLQTGIRQF